MPSVRLAPATRQAFRKITATDSRSTDQSATTRKFWCVESDSDSDDEDLGDAAPSATPSTVADSMAPTPSSPEDLPRRATRPSMGLVGQLAPSPRRIKLPIRPWKGPLPPPRFSPASTIGDFLQQAFQRVNGRLAAADPQLAQAPYSMGFRILNSEPE